MREVVLSAQSQQVWIASPYYEPCTWPIMTTALDLCTFLLVQLGPHLRS